MSEPPRRKRRSRRLSRDRWIVRCHDGDDAPVITLQTEFEQVHLASSAPRASLDRRGVTRLREALDEAAIRAGLAGADFDSPLTSPLRRGEPSTFTNGPTRLGSVPIMTALLHDQWCGWPTRVRHPEYPGLQHCAGCGLYVREVDPS